MIKRVKQPKKIINIDKLSKKEIKELLEKIQQKLDKKEE